MYSERESPTVNTVNQVNQNGTRGHASPSPNFQRYSFLVAVESPGTRRPHVCETWGELGRNQLFATDLVSVDTL
jgi:hypothetical protein